MEGYAATVLAERRGWVVFRSSESGRFTKGEFVFSGPVRLFQAHVIKCGVIVSSTPLFGADDVSEQ